MRRPRLENEASSTTMIAAATATTELADQVRRTETKAATPMTTVVNVSRLREMKSYAALTTIAATRGVPKLLR